MPDGKVALFCKILYLQRLLYTDKKVFKAHCYSPQIAKKRRTSYIIFFLFLLIKIYLFIIPFLMEI